MEKNIICGCDTQIILDSLQKNEQLSLQLTGNSINGRVLSILAANLSSRRSSLQSLFINFSRIGTDVARSLSRALENNATLLTLDLEYNAISSLDDISVMVMKNSTLQNLHLGYNYINTTDVYKLLRALKYNTTLTNVRLSGNPLHREFLDGTYGGCDSPDLTLAIFDETCINDDQIRRNKKRCALLLWKPVKRLIQ
jgi:hypothetical protein